MEEAPKLAVTFSAEDYGRCTTNLSEKLPREEKEVRVFPTLECGAVTPLLFFVFFIGEIKGILCDTAF